MELMRPRLEIDSAERRALDPRIASHDMIVRMELEKGLEQKTGC